MSNDDYSLRLTRLAETYDQEGKIDEAETAYRRALDLDHNNADAATKLADTYARQGRYKEALCVYEYILDISPATPALLNNVACVLKELGKLGEAETHYRNAIKLQPTFIEAYNNLGVVLREQGRLTEAYNLYGKAVGLKPDSAVFEDNMGSVLMELGRYEEAEIQFRKAIALDETFYQAGFDLSYLLLSTGRYKEGFEKYELRLHRPGAAYLSTGKPRLKAGQKGLTILVRAEQGLGDTVNFVRFLSLLKNSTGGSIILECQEQLFDLLKKVEGTDHVISRQPDAGIRIEHDVWIPLLSLPFHLGTTPEIIPSLPYIHPDRCNVEDWKQRIRGSNGHGQLNIGLAWAGNPKNSADRNRSIHLSKFLPLLGIDGTEFYSLQFGEEALGEIKSLPETARDRLHLYTADIQAFTQTAALIQNLDLIITVDSVVGHIAGAIGKPVWNILPVVPDWRWGLETERTPWYPTMRLIRQSAADTWIYTMQRIHSRIRELLRQ